MPLDLIKHSFKFWEHSEVKYLQHIPRSSSIFKVRKFKPAGHRQVSSGTKNWVFRGKQMKMHFTISEFAIDRYDALKIHSHLNHHNVLKNNFIQLHINFLQPAMHIKKVCFDFNTFSVHCVQFGTILCTQHQYLKLKHHFTKSCILKAFFWDLTITIFSSCLCVNISMRLNWLNWKLLLKSYLCLCVSQTFLLKKRDKFEKRC